MVELERLHGPCSASWVYQNAQGEPVGVVVRWDLSDGKKSIRPICRHKDGWRIGGMPTPRPLYRLPELATAKRVYICEGEKAVEAARSLGLVATTSPHGAQSAGQADWTPLSGKELILLPDHDRPGEKYIGDVAQILAKLNPASIVKRVELPNLPTGGDMADFVAARPDLPAKALRLQVETLAASAKQIEAEQETERVQPFVPFPVDALPEPVASFIYLAAEALGCDSSYIALPLLTALATAIGNSRRVQLKRSWREPCVFWSVIIGESGTLKSPALDLALTALRNRQSAAYRVYEAAMLDFERDRQIYDADHAEWKRKGRKNSEPPPTAPIEPVCERFVCEDTTVEALAVLLQDQPRGLLAARDELSGWLNSFDAYKSARGADVAHWLSMHRAGNMLVDRKSGRRMIRVPRAAVSICGGVQPLTLTAALGGRYDPSEDEAMEKPPSEHFANGLAARLLLTMPPRVPKRWTEADVDETAMATIESLFLGLLTLEMGTDENGDPQPLDLPLTPAAKRLWIDFYNDHATEQCELGGDLAAAWSKLEGYAPRFALLFHLIRSVAQDPLLSSKDVIDDASMTSAIEVVRWFGDEAARVYGEIGSSGTSAEARTERNQQRLRQWIHRKGDAVTAREVQQGCRWLKESGAAEAALEDLAKAGKGVWENTAATAKGGRPSRVFKLSAPSNVYETPTIVEPNASSVDVDAVDNTQSHADGEWGEV